MCAEEQESQSASLPYPRPARSGEVGELVTVHRPLRLQSATEREQKADFPLSYEVIKNIWRSFSDLGQYEANVVDTTDQTVEESIALIQERLQAGEFRLGE